MGAMFSMRILLNLHNTVRHDCNLHSIFDIVKKLVPQHIDYRHGDAINPHISKDCSRCSERINVIGKQ